MKFPSASYDQWKTRSPDDDRPPDEFEDQEEAMVGSDVDGSEPTGLPMPEVERLPAQRRCATCEWWRERAAMKGTVTATRRARVTST